MNRSLDLRGGLALVVQGVDRRLVKPPVVLGAAALLFLDCSRAFLVCRLQLLVFRKRAAWQLNGRLRHRLVLYLDCLERLSQRFRTSFDPGLLECHHVVGAALRLKLMSDLDLLYKGAPLTALLALEYLGLLLGHVCKGLVPLFRSR